MISDPQWLQYVKKLQFIAQSGLTYSKDPYDIERFEQVLEIVADIASHHTNINSEKILDIFHKEDGYLTPKIDVRAVIFKDSKLLLVKESLDGKWALPGGWADSHLSLQENLIKESEEEAGATIEPERIIAIHDRKKHNSPPLSVNVYKIFVLCKLLDFKFVENTETSEAKFYSLDELPELSTGRNNSSQIEMCFKALHNTEIDFD